MPAELPLRGSAPLTGVSACLAPACWSALGVGLEGSLLRHLVFSHVPCSSSGPAACAVFPAAGSLGVFRSPGVCPSASLVPWVGLSPSLLYGLLLLRLLAGVVGVFAPCVRVLQLRWCLLGLMVQSPCCPSLTFGWVCFWPTVSPAFVGCEGGPRLPFVVRHLFPMSVGPSPFLGLGGLVAGLWPLLRLLGFGFF